ARPAARRGAAPPEGPSRGRGRDTHGPQPAGRGRPALPRAQEAPRAAPGVGRGRAMTRELHSDPDREGQLHEVLLAYVEAAQEGRAPDRRQVLAAHPDLRPELEEFFASHDAVERLAAP